MVYFEQEACGHYNCLSCMRIVPTRYKYSHNCIHAGLPRPCQRCGAQLRSIEDEEVTHPPVCTGSQAHRLAAERAAARIADPTPRATYVQCAFCERHVALQRFVLHACGGMEAGLSAPPAGVRVVSRKQPFVSEDDVSRTATFHGCSVADRIGLKLRLATMGLLSDPHSPQRPLGIQRW